MIDPKLLRSMPEEVAARLKTRGFHLDVEDLKSREKIRKNLQVKMQEQQNERNVRSKNIGIAKAAGEEIESLLSDLKDFTHQLKLLENQFFDHEIALEKLFLTIPNLPHESVPIGETEKDNKEIRIVGTPREFSFQPKDHVDLTSKNNWMDFETAAKLAGARFVVLRGPMARLQRALIQFMLDIHITEHGYEEIAVPYLVNSDCLLGTGQLPKMKDDLFQVPPFDENGNPKWYLIPTSEVSVTNTVREQILESNELPIKYVCYSSCFRSEAGSYGKDMRGMLRQHQFEKVELVQIVKPEDSYAALEALTRHAETILQRLELPYRVMALCTGDIGFYAAKTYDLEVWLPGQNCYREISSCSNTEAFQARRMRATWRNPETGKIELVHTLNGSGLAVGRTLIAVIENYQDEFGRIHIPKALQPYMGGLEVIDPTKEK